MSVGQEGESMSNQNVSTPDNFVRAVEKLFGIKFLIDYAASEDNTKAPCFISEEINALTISWKVDCWGWLNPPYKNLTEWINKCAKEKELGSKIITIWPLSSDANQHRVWSENHVYIIEGRIFKEVRSCMLTVWNREWLGRGVHGLSWDKKESKLERIW